MATCADSISHKPRNPLSSVVTLGALYLTSLSILSAVAKPHTAYFSAKGFWRHVAVIGLYSIGYIDVGLGDV